MEVSAGTIPSDIGASKKAYRIESIDLLRGLIMIVMAIDHVRDYFHYAALLYDPTDLTQTNTILFFTRWITHFCAPCFMFLSGTSAYLVGIRKGKKALARFLWTRGLFLIILEFTVINFAWYFNTPFNSIDFLVIWALGISMLCLAALIWLPFPWILGFGLVMVVGHNLLDNVKVPGNGLDAFGWSLLHQQSFFQFKGHNVLVAYPIIPWIGVMALGYCLGKWFEKDVAQAKRKKRLLTLGAGAIILFILLRLPNFYGDPTNWSKQQSTEFTILSFINVVKYPPSLLYLLVTLGPALIFLAFTENSRSWLAEKIKVIGRVPMFYYLAHLYLIHLAALFATYFCGFKPGDMILDNFIMFEPQLRGYGFSLGITYVVWFILVVILYFLCRWYDKYKRTHHQWWLSYI